MMEMMGYDLPFPCHSERSEESPPFAQRKGASGMPVSKTSAYAFNNQHPSFNYSSQRRTRYSASSPFRMDRTVVSIGLASGSSFVD